MGGIWAAPARWARGAAPSCESGLDFVVSRLSPGLFSFLAVGDLLALRGVRAAYRKHIRESHAIGRAVAMLVQAPPPVSSKSPWQSSGWGRCLTGDRVPVLPSGLFDLWLLEVFEYVPAAPMRAGASRLVRWALREDNATTRPARVAWIWRRELSPEAVREDSCTVLRHVCWASSGWLSRSGRATRGPTA